MDKQVDPAVSAYLSQLSRRRKRAVLHCAVCGKEFEAVARARYCSTTCRVKAFHARKPMPAAPA